MEEMEITGAAEENVLPGGEELPRQTEPTVPAAPEELAAAPEPDAPRTPTVAELEQRLNELTRQMQQQAARRQLDEQLDAIRRLDPELGSLEQLQCQPEFEQFDTLVRAGNDLVSAYKLAFFDRYARRSAEAARQAAINGARAKHHLASVGSGPMPAEDGLTEELIRNYRLYNPGMSRAQIARYHARYRKEKQNV